MALNKFMHPRNIYKTPPDFLKLANDYKAFSDIAKKDISGKVSIDFKDPKALRVLTKCLLKLDFNLDVTIPEDRLVPTLPLRLNYILWIEDILSAVQNKDPIWGIDIGTGACAIYPLLAAAKNEWYMVGTETDVESLRIAKENVEKNNLHHLIELKENPATCIFKFIFKDDNERVFNFCMCNPPFYTNLQELWESRSPARPAPKNGFTGSPHELITEGGELQFCRKMIEESRIYRDKILIFTTMVGHKYNLKELVIDLKAEGIIHTTTEFCQGRVTRWGLAWTYQDYDFSMLVAPKGQLRKKNSPIIAILPDLSAQKNNIAAYLEKIKTTLLNLKIVFNIISKRKNEVSISIIAHSNTWSNQRRKRRLQKRMEESRAKQPKTELVKQNSEQGNDQDEPQEQDVGKKGPKEEKESSSQQGNDQDEPQEHVVGKKDPKEEKEPSSKQLIKDEEDIILQGIMRLFMKDNHFNIELEYLNGIAGKEGLHQIVQYIKNSWK